MKLKFSHYFSCLSKIIFHNFNFIVALVGSAFYFVQTSVSLDFYEINRDDKQDMIIIIALFAVNIVCYLAKRISVCSPIIHQILEVGVAILSMEIFFSIEQCKGEGFVLSLLQLQYLLSSWNEKKQLTIYMIWLSLIYFILRFYLFLSSYTTQSLLKASLILFFFIMAYIFGYHVEVVQQSLSMNDIDKTDGQQIQKKTKNLLSMYKNSNNLSTKSFFNFHNTNKKKQENLLKPQTETFLKNPFSQRGQGEDELQLNNSNQIQIPIILGNKQRESDIESFLFSYRTPINEQQIMKQSFLQEMESRIKQDGGSHQNSNIFNYNANSNHTQDECQKSTLPGTSQNYSILSELSIGLIIVDDQKQILFSNERSHQILKESNPSNLINKLFDYVTSIKGNSHHNKMSNINNLDLFKSASAQEISEDRSIRKDRKQFTQTIQRMSSIQIREGMQEESSSPLLDPRKIRAEQNRKGSSRLFASLKDVVNLNQNQNSSFIQQDTSKITKLFSGNLNLNDEKLSLSDYKDDTGIMLNPYSKSQQGNKVSFNQDGPSTTTPQKSNQMIQVVETKKSEFRRLNLNLNKELQNFLKRNTAHQTPLKQIFEILLEASNYQQIEQSNNNNGINGLMKSKSEQMIDSISSESKYFYKKSDFLNTQFRSGQDFIQGSTIIRNRRDSLNSQDDSMFQSREVNPLDCQIQDNTLIIKALKGNDVIDLKVSVMLEFSTIYENKNQRDSGSGEAGEDKYQDKAIISIQRFDKFRESLEEFKQQQNLQKCSSNQITSIMYNDVKNDKYSMQYPEKSKKKWRNIKNCDMKLFLIIEVQDKQEEMKQVNQEVFKDFKNRILSSLSHELRTPLNCSLSMLETLFHSDLLNEQQKKMLILPALNSNYLLLSMINDILDFAQLINGGLNLQFHEFSILELLRECMSYFTLQAAHKNIYMELIFEKNLPNTIRSDSMRMKQVIINLLGNAIKFTNSGSIEISVDLEEKDLIKISIKDTGCGIPPEIGNKIFKGLEFNQNSTHFNTEGAGMGLTIANNISKGLSGNRPIQFTSEVNKGSKFSFFVLDRPSKIKGCKSTKFTIFNRSFTNWKPLFQEASEKVSPSTVFDQLTANNNRIIGSNSMLPQTGPPGLPLINNSNQVNSSQLQIGGQTPFISQLYPFAKSNTFSNSSLPQRSFNDFTQRIVSYINSNNQPISQTIPVSQINNFKNQGFSRSDEQIPSFNQIPKSFQDLSFAKNTLTNQDNNASLDQQYNINFPSEGNIIHDQSTEHHRSKYNTEQINYRKQLELFKLQHQLNVQQQQQLFPNSNIHLNFKHTSAKSIMNNITSLKQFEENGGMNLVSKKSCEVETEHSQINNPASPQINQVHFIVAHKKQTNPQYNHNTSLKNNEKPIVYQNHKIYDEVVQEDRIEKTNKQICYTDEPGSVYLNMRDEFSNKHISPKQIHSMRTLFNDQLSLSDNKQQKQHEEDGSMLHQHSHLHNLSNKNSTNQLGQSTNSKNHVRIKDLEIEDIQTHLMYFLSLQQSSHISHMYQSIPQQQAQNYVYNSHILNNNANCSSPHNPSLLGNSFSHQSNLSNNNNQQKNSTPQVRHMDTCSPRSQKSIMAPSLQIQVQNAPYQPINIQGGKLGKKMFQLDGSRNLDTNSQNSPMQNLPNIEDQRQRVDSVRSRNKESLNVRMEYIIETHENQEMDENTHSDNNLANSCKSSLKTNTELANNNYDQNVYKQKIIQKNKQKSCNCPNVLIVDDNDFNLFALEMRLKQYGFLVETANSGILGQQKVIKRHQEHACCRNYTLIFMDLDMPIQNGFQTTINIIQYYKQINQIPPVISACTAFVQDAEKRKAKQAGMKYYLTKPVETSSLEKIISKVLFQSG